jgi:predicted aspartyl protease
MAKAQINGTIVDALVDCGSSFTVINERSAQVAGLRPESSRKVVLHVLDGRQVSTFGVATAELRIGGFF